MNKRDLHADLVKCNAATPMPWIVDVNLANQIRQPNVSKRRRIMTPPDANGLGDASFIAEARQGWPEAIRRAIAAEKEVDRLQEVLREIHGHIGATYDPIPYIVETLHQMLPEYTEKPPEL